MILSSSRIARRLMVRLAIAGLALAMVMTGLLLAVDYRRGANQVLAGLDRIEDTYLGSIIENTWLEDTDRLTMLVEGIRHHPGVARVVVRTPSGKELAASGTLPAGATPILRTWPLIRTYQDRPLTIGALEVSAELDGVFARTLARAWWAMLASAVLTLALSSLLYLMVHRMVARRLSAVARHARRLGELGLAAAPAMPANDPAQDELSDLAHSFNDMRAALEASDTAIREREARYRELFTSFPIALWEEDFSEVKTALDALRASVDDVEQYIADNPDFLRAMVHRVRILDLNNAALTLHCAGDREELLRRLSAIFTPTSFDAFRRQLIAIWRGECDLVVESEVRTLDGDIRQVTVRWFVPPSARHDLSRVIVTTDDITERKLAARSLEITLEKLTEANAELERFAYAASHDLKEPVRGVVSFSQLLERRLSALGQNDAQVKEFLDFLKAAGLRMQDQIGGLMDYTRAGITARPFEHVALSDALADALQARAETMEAAGVRFHADLLPTVFGDRALLADVFRQLLDNAVKFRRPDVPPEITVTSEREGDEWRITVRDNGIGLDPVYAGQLFQVFRRLHGAAKYPGAGIGLATCRRIVERHGGHIWVSPPSGPGAVFNFTLPALPN